MDEDAPTQSDYELALNMACGDEDAIRTFIALHGPRICGFLKKNYYGIWEDAWQVFIIHLVDRIDRFDPEKGSLKSWSTKLAQNCAKSILRVESRQLVHRAQEDIETVAEISQPKLDTPKQRKKVEHQREQIQEAVNTLPEKERRVILADFAHRDGRAPANELANGWETTTNAIHQARFRAIKKLREELMRRGIYREGDKS